MMLLTELGEYVLLLFIVCLSPGTKKLAYIYGCLIKLHTDAEHLGYCAVITESLRRDM